MCHTLTFYKCKDDVQSLRFSKNNVPWATKGRSTYSCQNNLFRSVDYFDILFRGVNELSIIFDAFNNLIQDVNELHITFPGVDELNIL